MAKKFSNEDLHNKLESFKDISNRKIDSLSSIVMELQKDFREMHDWWKFEQGAKSARSFTDGNITTQDIFKFFKKVTLALIGLLVTAFGIIQLLVNR